MMNDESKRKRSSKTSRRLSTRPTRQVSPQSTSTQETIETDILNFILGDIAQDRNESVRNDLSTISNSETETILLKKSQNSTISLGAQRREELTQCMRKFYENCFEFDENSTISSVTDPLINTETRKQYANDLWFELKAFFRGINTKNEKLLGSERISIDRQRRESLEKFYLKFRKANFQQFSHYDRPTIHRYQICENHLHHCHDVEKYLVDLFSQWDEILSLFPSQSALEQFDRRFDPQTQEGAIFTEKLTMIQAWFNLNAEINHLISVLGRLMSCSRCHAWPHISTSTGLKHFDLTSRPPTPSSSSSNDQRDFLFGSPPRSSSFTNTFETKIKHPQTMLSMPSMDSLYQQPLGTTAALTDYYYRYIDDQVTHARIELVARIFRSKHGPLLQRLRYTYEKKQSANSLRSENTLKNSTYLPANVFPTDYLSDAKPDKLMEEFFMLNKQLKDQRNPNFAKSSTKRRSDRINSILTRFEQNPTLTSSTFPSVSAPTLVLKLLSHDRTVLKRQAYFLDCLDPNSYPHLPGSTLFPDPCTFLDPFPFESYFQSTSDENLLIAKMLTICHRLYAKDVWLDNGRFSDMWDIFRLPSFYPQYVFLTQIPLDLMLIWHKYHNDKRMEQTSTTRNDKSSSCSIGMNERKTRFSSFSSSLEKENVLSTSIVLGALLLLIDECKVLIHSGTVVRQYIKSMIDDTFERTELQLLENDIVQFDRHIVENLNELLGYIERYVEISLHSNYFHNCFIFLRDQWKSLKKYFTMMNVEEILGEKFLLMFSTVIKHFHSYIDVFHVSSTDSTSENVKIDHMKKKFHQKFQKKLTMDILREAKTIYDDCALTMNIYLEKRVCKRFLLILKTAGFKRIRFEEKSPKERSTLTKCHLFAPTEFFDDPITRIQLARTISSSFRLPTSSTIDSSSEESNLNSISSPTTTTTSTIDSTLVYVLAVPICDEIENEWRGIDENLFEKKIFSSIVPLNVEWKTTSLFLLTQQTQQFAKINELFKERLSQLHVQQNDFYKFETNVGEILQRRSCFEKVDRAMNDLAHSISSLANCVTENVEKFEKLIEKFNTRVHVHIEERIFAFAMDVVREASFYATQFDQKTLKSQSNRQISFANIWLNFVQKKKSISIPKYPFVIPMWLLPGLHFLLYICSNFSQYADDEVFSSFYQNLQRAMYHWENPLEINSIFFNRFRSKPTESISTIPIRRNSFRKHRKTKIFFNRIEKLERMDKRIDRRRLDDGLIGQIKHVTRPTFVSRQMEEQLASFRIHNFHKLSPLPRGQFAMTYKCTAKIGDEKEKILCYKQYQIEHNDARATIKILERLIQLMHTRHEHVTRYYGIALEPGHILSFMEFCQYGTIAQLLLGNFHSSQKQIEKHRFSSNLLTCSLEETTLIDDGIIQSTAGFAFFEEFLVRNYVRQLLTALSYLHGEKILHRDIRNVNIFLTDATKQSIKLGDINILHELNLSPNDVSLVLRLRESIVFYAPETIIQNITTNKSDIWSLGCSMIHMLSGRIPWNIPNIGSNVYYVHVISWMANNVQPPIPTDLHLSTECVDFLEKCFQHDPNQRPSSDELLKHPFITKF